jgi:uncharacterized protein involved in exopolysaccharide biosynthesis
LTRARAWGGAPGDAPISAWRRDHVITNVHRAIRVRRQGATYVASVSVTARSPARARQMVATFIELYFAQRMQRPAQGTRTADRWLAQQLDQLRAQMRAKEDAVATLRAQRRQISPESGAPHTPVDQAAVQAARADVADKEARLRQVRLDPSIALQSSTIRELQTREADASRLEVEFSERYGAQHPKLQSARAERESVRAQIRSEISRVAAHMNNEVEAARRRLAELETRLTEVETSLSPGSDADSAQLRELERDAAAIRARYQSYLARQQEMTQDRLRPTGVALVAAASTPLRQNPANLALLLLLAVGLGLPAGVGLAYLLALADHSLRDLGEVERELGLPGLVAILDLPRSARDSVEGADRGPAGYVAAKPLSKFAEPFRSLQQSPSAKRHVQQRCDAGSAFRITRVL